MDARRTALFVDFDNFFGGLLAADPEAALAVVERPSVWLRRLADAHHDDVSRRWLILRSYMNPAGWVDDPRAPGTRLYFSKFRPFFTRAGFEVIDCPSLTRGAKNGADIRITIDVMTAMRATVRYDEFIIASSDADFTPLLQVVRAEDRYITVIATGPTSAAYEALADRYLDEQDVVDLMSEPGDDVGIDNLDVVDEPVPVPATPVPTTSVSADKRAFRQWIEAAYARADEPLNLAQLAEQAARHLGPAARASRWFGAGSFVKAVTRLDLPNVGFSQHHMWDVTRHEPPVDAMAAETGPVELPAAVSAFSAITNLPRIGSDSWPVIFELLAEYLHEGTFSLTEATRWPRHRAAERGLQIPRSGFMFAVRACRWAGTMLNTEPNASAKDIGRLVLDGVLAQSRLAGMDPTDAEIAELRSWLHVD
ncbi:NYN domain-containing protein [Virgisporangium ochraceum]|uniref:NYN domain-containing protein n=1 Tax=Virgisporangium ochraceum TaxID=65505 RepID=A0A8J3ZZZ2_9ACTN|nr:NYN domain-containing protein [Virgisporangium ochraceum]GIJ70580.1 NYN domain-containing protein [Virgisporangium ochraceum]